ncbi:hypothetical protein [Streptomyces sp. NBC_00035]|uniref:hypothetical protein n=1 Tax=Streptomyces sp. NBC_00035 TaxID=2903614 RepID=UPI003243B386
MDPVRIEDLPDEERQPFHGITNIVVMDPEFGRAAAARIGELHTAMLTFVRAYARAIHPAIEEMGRIFQALRDAGPIDESGKPTRSPDRPAWQSPYGPPRRGPR